MSGFIKYNKGKPDFTLLDSGIFRGIEDISNYGTWRYSRDNWKKAFIDNPYYGIYVYTQAFYRHAIDMLTDEIDSDSGRPHRWCCAWNLMAVEYGYSLLEKIPASKHKKLKEAANKRIEEESRKKEQTRRNAKK